MKCVALVAIACSSYAQVVINEVQPVPPIGEPEWVELYNPTDTDVTLTGLYLYDRTSRVLLSSVTVPARGFAVLTRDTEDLKLLRRIPPIARLYQLALPTLNNTTESLFIATRDTIVLDSMYYDMRWGIRGRTLERIDPLRPGYLRNNIAACIAPDSATCGYDNSVSLVERDVHVLSLRVDSTLTLWIGLANRGRTPFTQLLLDLRIRRPPQDAWIALGQVTIEHLPPAATSEQPVELRSFIKLEQFGFGMFELQAVAQVQDQRSWNDTATTSLFIPFLSGSITINEIMYDPTDGKSEYIELANTTDDTLYLGGLLVGDQIPPQTALPMISVEPHGLVVIALDTNIWNIFPELRGNPRCIVVRSSWTLSNTGEMLYVTNPNGSTVDSVFYLPSWHFWGLKNTKGRSLEKLRPRLPSNEQRSWSSSTDVRGGTPAAPNSISPPDTAIVSLSASPNPFSPMSTDARLQQTAISYRLPWQSARLTLRIYDPNGIPVRELANGIYTGAEGSLLWDGRNDAGYAVGAGAYILFLEATDTLSNNSIREHSVVIIGK